MLKNTILLFLLLVLSLCWAKGNLDFNDNDFYENDRDFLIAQNDHRGPPPMDMDDPGFEHFRKGRFDKDDNKKISEKLENRILRALDEHFPVYYDKVISLKTEHPVIYNRLLHKLRRFIRRSREPKDEKKDVITMIFEEVNIDILVKKFRETDNPAQKEKIKKEIRHKMSEAFDKRLEIGEKIIKKIERDIDQKKKDHKYQITNKEKLIDERLENLLK